METLKTQLGIAIVFMFLMMGGVMSSAKADQELTFSPDTYVVDLDIPDLPKATKSQVSLHSTKDANKPDDYKSQRLREMADMWVGTVLEPHTEKLLAMLLTEDGTLTAERRHDCNMIKYKGRILKGCFAVGIMGHNICARGTPIVSEQAGKPKKNFCYDYAMTDFEKEYPGFSSDWRIQFSEFSFRMTNCINSGKTVNRCVQDWNPHEAGRIAKVENHEYIVEKALDL